MSFDSKKVVPEYQNLLGFRPFRDPVKIPLPASLTDSTTGEYYQEQHPALALDIIQTLIPPDHELEDYLQETIEGSINGIFNDLLQYRKLKNYGKSLLENSVLLDRYGWNKDLITNQNRFVGMQIRVKSMEGLTATIDAIGFQFSQPEPALKIYVFHPSRSEPVTTFDVDIKGNGQWTWTTQNINLSSFSSSEFSNDPFIVGYYQDDLEGSAINYSNFNWDTGVCGGCNNSHFKVWQNIRTNFHVYPLYVPGGNFIKGEMFDFENAVFDRNQSFGLNFKFTVKCDLTDFFIRNKFAFKNLLSHKVVWKILKDMKFSQQINSVEENIKMMIIRDLEGDIETDAVNIPSLYHRELKSVAFDISGINAKCLGCEASVTAPRYGVV